jgi:MYXO-CTERM domain-containing protein
VRATAIVFLLLAACGPRPGAEEPQAPMPSETLDKQDPKAKYEHYEPRKPSFGSRLKNSFWPWRASTPDPFTGSSEPPHYYTGCGGCASDDRSSLLVVLLLAGLIFRRSRR